MSLPDDILLEEIWQYLPAETLLKYCQTNKTINSICNRNSTWKHLIQSDFAIDYVGYDAKEEYIRLYNFEDIDLSKKVALESTHFRYGGMKSPFLWTFYQRLDRYANPQLVAIANHFLGTNFKIESLGDSVHFDRDTVIRDLLHHFEKVFDTPKSYRKLWSANVLQSHTMAELLNYPPK